MLGPKYLSCGLKWSAVPQSGVIFRAGPTCALTCDLCPSPLSFFLRAGRLMLRRPFSTVQPMQAVWCVQLTLLMNAPQSASLYLSFARSQPRSSKLVQYVSNQWSATASADPVQRRANILASCWTGATFMLSDALRGSFDYSARRLLLTGQPVPCLLTDPGGGGKGAPNIWHPINHSFFSSQLRSHLG